MAENSPEVKISSFILTNVETLSQTAVSGLAALSPNPNTIPSTSRYVSQVINMQCECICDIICMILLEVESCYKLR